MKSKTVVKFVLAGVGILTGPALTRAWPACSGKWVQVPNGTTGSYKSGDVSFECKTTPPVKPANQTQNQGQYQGQAQNQGQTQGQTSNSTSNSQSSANNSGNNNTTVTDVTPPKIPVSAALGLAPPATITCFKGYGAGVQTMAVGGSFGGGKIDENCAVLETARSLASVGAMAAYCKVMLTDKYVKKAGVTFEDCMATPVPVLIAPARPEPVVITPQITVNVPPPIIEVTQAAPSLVLPPEKPKPPKIHKHVPPCPVSGS